jgi:hypothetical protein
MTTLLPFRKPLQLLERYRLARLVVIMPPTSRSSLVVVLALVESTSIVVTVTLKMGHITLRILGQMPVALVAKREKRRVCGDTILVRAVSLATTPINLQVQPCPLWRRSQVAQASELQPRDHQTDPISLQRQSPWQSKSNLTKLVLPMKDL